MATSDFSKLRQTQNNLLALIQAMEQMSGMPRMLADTATDATADAYAPLRQMKKAELPENVKGNGRALRDAAQAFAEAPDRETLTDWRVAARQLHNALNDTALRKRIRAADTVPPKPQKISPEAILPGMAAREAYGVPDAGRVNWQANIPGEGW